MAALFIARYTHPQPQDPPVRDDRWLTEAGQLGSYRAQIGWAGAGPRARCERSARLRGRPDRPPPITTS
ncbi:hypothetical protein [Kitasatospora sp. NPDC005751]|uniref:hypothetical protein n=1 Tax=Kitasatospora sp. NPDC005751 TaxID=3157064 RepID=UPI0033F2E072